MMRKLNEILGEVIFLANCKDNNPVEPQNTLSVEFQKIIDSLYSSSGISTR
ncbi:MAG: hypothetical protein M5U17_15205 [Ignavibacterium sp.]|nr:hypothetical protein [Ignavibacterium sp.]